MIIEQPSAWLRLLYPKALWRIKGNDQRSKCNGKYPRTVYLTFDDGPIPEVTPWVLDVLDRYGIKATFFMVGDNIRKHPEEFRMVVARGHRIGNHTFNHLGGFTTHTVAYVRNIHKAQAIMKAELSKLNSQFSIFNSQFPKPLFRPPHGWLRHRQYHFVKRHYRLVMWDLVTRDYSRRLNAEQVFANVCRYARPGSIITFHDSLRSRDKLVSALPRSIEWLLQQGYTFATID